LLIPFERLSEYERTLYLALRRGLLLVEAQMRWLAEASAYLQSGSLNLRGRAKDKPRRATSRKPKVTRRR
jgi:hypothetical protein